MRSLAFIAVSVLLSVFAWLGSAMLAPSGNPLVATFSIVAVDTITGEAGVAVQSKFPNVRPVVPWAEAGVGAVATQSFANVSFGPRGLNLLRNGASAVEALRILVDGDSGRAARQVGIVDARGGAASWTGDECFDWAGGAAGKARGGKGSMISGRGFAAQGNILVNQETVETMAATFEATSGSLADRLLAALVAGGRAGGDRRGEESAALLVKRKGGGYDASMDDYIDISIYDHPHPLAELVRLYNLHKLHFFRSVPEHLLTIGKNICSELQTILSNREYKGILFYDGPVNGVFDEKTKKALQDFMGWENYDVRIRNDDRIDSEVLEDIRNKYESWKTGRK